MKQLIRGLSDVSSVGVIFDDDEADAFNDMLRRKLWESPEEIEINKLLHIISDNMMTPRLGREEELKDLIQSLRDRIDEIDLTIAQNQHLASQPAYPRIREIVNSSTEWELELIEESIIQSLCNLYLVIISMLTENRSQIAGQIIESNLTQLVESLEKRDIQSCLEIIDNSLTEITAKSALESPVVTTIEHNLLLHNDKYVSDEAVFIKRVEFEQLRISLMGELGTENIGLGKALAYIQLYFRTIFSLSEFDEIALLNKLSDNQGYLYKFITNEIAIFDSTLAQRISEVVGENNWMCISALFERIRFTKSQLDTINPIRIDLHRVTSLESMYGEQLDTQEIIPDIETTQKIDLFTGIEVQLGDHKSIRARLVHSEDYESLGEVKRLTDIGYGQFNADTHKQKRIDSTNPKKTYSVLVEHTFKGEEGQTLTIPMATISLEMITHLDSGQGLTETLRLTSPKSVIEQELAQFIAMKKDLSKDLGEEADQIDLVKIFAEGGYTDGTGEFIPINGIHTRRSALNQIRQLDKETLKEIGADEIIGVAEIESLAFTNIPNLSVEMMLRNGGIVEDILPKFPGTSTETFGIEYSLAIAIAAEATRRIDTNIQTHRDRTLMAMVQPGLYHKLAEDTGVTLRRVGGQALNPFVTNKGPEGNGTRFNLDYFLKFHPYFLRQYFKDRFTDPETRTQQVTTLIEAINCNETQAYRNEFMIDLAKYMISQPDGKSGPIVVYFNQEEYVRQLTDKANKAIVRLTKGEEELTV